MSNPIFVTGFNAFGSLAQNPSEELVKQLSKRYGSRIRTLILRTSYAESAASLRELLQPGCPAGLLMFGYGASVKRGLRLERQANNVSTARQLDNDGLRSTGEAVQGAPATHRTTVKTDELANQLRNRGIHVELSDDAGSYVCNHAYFIGLHLLRERGCTAPCLFVHIPNPSKAEEWNEIEAGAQVLTNNLLRSSSL